VNENAPAAGAVIEPCLLETTRGTMRLPDADGRATLLMFFVEAGTPTCDAQVAALEADAAAFEEADAVGIAVSVDPLDLLCARPNQFSGSPIALATDADGALARRFGVYDEQQRRARRAAFVIAGDGTVLAAEGWYNPRNSAQYAALFAALFAAQAARGG
jgi:peroxiredoxin